MKCNLLILVFQISSKQWARESVRGCFRSAELIAEGGPTMSYHQHYQRGPHGRTMSSEERSSTPVNKTSTPVHKSASSSSSSQRDSRQVIFMPQEEKIHLESVSRGSSTLNDGNLSRARTGRSEYYSGLLQSSVSVRQLMPQKIRQIEGS